MKVECLLLTWHGTLVCAEAGRAGMSNEAVSGAGVPTHAVRLSIETPGDVHDHGSTPFSEDRLSYESAALGTGIAHLSDSGYGYHFPREGRYLCASRDDSWVEWNREHSQTWETFLPVPEEVMRKIIALRSSDWVNLSTHETIAGPSIAFQREFFVPIGTLMMSLTTTYPKFFQSEAHSAGEPVKEAMFMLKLDSGMHAYASSNAAKTPESGLWLRNAEHDPSEDPADDRMPMEVRSPQVLYYPPAFAHRSDREIFFNRASHGKPRVGFTTNVVRIRRAHDVHALLGRSVEGTLFGAKGVIRHYGFLTVSAALPRGISKMGERFYLDRPLFNNAPHLSGDYLLFYNGNLQNYFHWLIEGILSLYLLNKAHGPGAKLILPSALKEAAGLPYFESLQLFGLDHIERVTSAEPAVRLERAYWIDAEGDLFGNMPEEVLLELQANIARSLNIVKAKNRVYVEREGFRKIKNADEVRRFFEDRGFVTVRLDKMPLMDQARTFASAEFVAGPHGAGLSNLLFTPPHARVIEFIPNHEIRPFFWQISSKLGHEYGMMPCQTERSGFNDDMLVDMPKLGRLFAFLEHA